MILLIGGVIVFSGRFFSSGLVSSFSSIQKHVQLFFTSIRHAEDIKTQNLELQARISELEAFESENTVLQSQISLLQEESGIRLQGVNPPLLTHIIPSPTLFQSGERLITAGAIDGVQLNDLVMASGSLVGKVVEVFRHYSKIQLLYHKESVFKVELPGKQFATLSGIIEPQRLLLTEIARDAQIEVGMKVQLASSVEYPERMPLLIGEIIEVEDVKEQPFLKAYVKPYIEYDFLDNVLVLVSS